MPTIKLVYQDCPMCGAREDWGEKQTRIANESGLEIEKVSFASPEGSHLCKEAIYAGVTKLPFFTDGLIFRESLEDWTKGKKPARKTTKKTRKKTEAKK